MSRVFENNLQQFRTMRVCKAKTKLQSGDFYEWGSEQMIKMCMAVLRYPGIYGGIYSLQSTVEMSLIH